MIIDSEKCIGCGNCVQDCPLGILSLEDGKAKFSKAGCILCGHCYSICPTEAVSFDEEGLEGSENLTMEEGRLDPDQLLRAIKTRRSVRKFKDKEIEPEKLQKIIDAIQFTPSGANRQAAGIIIVKDQIDQITSECLEGLKHCASHPEDAGAPYPPHFAPRWIQMDKEYREEGKDGLYFHAKALLVLTASEIVSHVIDASLAASMAELMTAAEGLGCVYIGFARYVMNMPHMRKRLGIPDDYRVVCCLAIGYPDVHYFRTPPRKKREVNYF